MFIELVDSLRCVEPHEDTWLVASVWQMDGRHIVEGILGCPICRREYPVRDGVGWFDGAAVSAEGLTPFTGAARPELVARAAALLGLSDAGGIIALGGHWATCADALADLGPTHLVLVNAAPGPSSGQETSGIAVTRRLPFPAGSLRGVALSGASASRELVAAAVDALRPRGRLVAPAALPLPDGVSELARDATDWVAERSAVASPPIQLRSARR